MFIDKHNTQFFKHLILRAARLPIIYVILGIACLVFSHIDHYFPQINTDIAEKAGNILISLGLIVFLYNTIALICKRYEATLADTHHIASLIIGSIRQGLRIIFILVFMQILISLSDPTEFFLLLTNGIIKVILISSIGWIAIQIIYTFEATIYQSMVKMSSQKDAYRLKDMYTKTHILRNIATIIIVVLTIAAILMSFSSVRNLGISLLASAGFFTAIAGLAAQKGLSSIFAGLQIALSQRIKIGDAVTIENASGVVEEINFTYVILRLSNQRRLVVPINFFIDKSFENGSREVS